MAKKIIADDALAPGAPVSFEAAMAELAQLVSQMESGTLALEASVAAYARGAELVKYCAAQLEKVEAQVKVIEGDMLKPFAAEALAGAGVEGDAP
ncbi:exodeoxyribonuclease VII small subunit [Massilia sp. DWR3-1-1]|uniref:exodeoxyribonuclease VII small subunit n=1 Tax=Massilia sp. DWR3-1-1 TaxID=2804559 RepID=UPI003CE8277A